MARKINIDSKKNLQKNTKEPTLFHHQYLLLCYGLNAEDYDEKWVVDVIVVVDQWKD
jgi:hypothetical protein